MKRELFRPQLQGRVQIEIRTTGVLPKPGALRAIRSGNPRGIQFDPALNTSFWTTFRPAAGQSPPVRVKAVAACSMLIFRPAPRLPLLDRTRFAWMRLLVAMEIGWTSRAQHVAIFPAQG